MLRLLKRETKDKIKDTIWKVTHIFSKFEPSENIIVFSDPRGGSTWITEMIMEIPKTAVLWEPLHLGAIDHFTKLGFSWRQYIPENENWKEAEKAFYEVLRGKVLTHWTCKMTTPYELLSSDRMIVKFVRANAMIPWLTKTFNFKLAPVLLLRHPFAVAASQLDYGAWDYEYTGFKIPDCPYNTIYKEHTEFLSTLHSKAEGLVASWCITNRIPLNNNRNNIDWITIYYEDLIMNPEKEMERLFNRWDIDMPGNVVVAMRHPSTTTKDATFEKSIEQQLSKWMKVYDTEQIIKLQRILDYFEVKVYNGKSVSPIEYDI